MKEVTCSNVMRDRFWQNDFGGALTVRMNAKEILMHDARVRNRYDRS